MSQTHLPPFDKAAYTPQDHPYAIHVGEVIEEKVHRRLPTPILRTLERVIHQREINDILYRYSHLEGMDFLEALVGEFRLDLGWVHPERLPEHGRCIFASNHPLGGMDGIAISYMLGRRYGDVRYMVNDMLYHLKPLQPVFLPLNKHGAQGKEAVTLLQEAMQSEVPIGTFPAGFCSRVYDGKIQDQIWRKTFVTQAIHHERDIVPLHFVGQNSRHFYWIWHLKNALRMKFDIGTALLPDELFRAAGKSFRIIVGEPIPWQSLRDSALRPEEEAARIRSICYALRDEYERRKK